MSEVKVSNIAERVAGIGKQKQGIVLLSLLQIFAVTILLRTFLPLFITRAIGALILFSVIYYSTSYLNKRTLFVFLSVAVFFSLNFLFSSDRMVALRDTVYFTSAVLLANLFCNSGFRESFLLQLKKNRLSNELVLFLCNAVLLIGFFDTNAYRIAWGGHEYFQGYAGGTHPIANASCLVIVFALIKIQMTGISLLGLAYFAIPTYAILMSGARTFLIAPVIILWLIYKNCNSKGFVKHLFIILGILAFVFLLLNSSTFLKFDFLLTRGQQNYSNLGVADSITNDRITLWTENLIEFASGNWLQIIFGRCFDFVFRFNRDFTIGAEIWSHNDIINLLLSIGLFGTFVYIWILHDFFKNTFRNNSGKLSKMLFVVYIVFPMMLNGFYAYQAYMFGAIMMSSVAFRKDLNMQTVDADIWKLA